MVKLARVALLGALGSVACSSHIASTQASEPAAAEDAGDSASSSSAAEVPRDTATPAELAPAAGCNPRTSISPPNSEVLRGFENGSPITGVAGDAHRNVLLARSGQETLKLTLAGALAWSKPFGALVATDGRDNVYVAGTLKAELPLGATVLRPHGGTDAYLVKLDSDGNVTYGLTLGAAEDDEALSLAAAADGEVVISGAGLGTVKLDASGNVAWTKPVVGYVALDSRGDVLVASELNDALDLGAGVLRSAGGADVLVVKLSALGVHIFSRRFGDAAHQRGQAIAVDAQDSVLVGGTFAGELDFGVGVLSLPAGTCSSQVWCQAAGFVAKLDQDGNALWSVSSGPMRSVAGLSVDSRGNVLVSGALPGNVTPFHMPTLTELSSDGAQRWQRSEWPETGIGAGHGVLVDRCDDVLWSVSALPTLGADERPYLARLSQ